MALARESTTELGSAVAKKSTPMYRRAKSVEYVCEDYPDFRPNLSPREILLGGAFGGTYFRDIRVNGVRYVDAWREFATPATDWFDGLDIRKQVASPRYDAHVNKYKVKCGQSLDVWVEKGWIKPEVDSHGWFHWYCRFFLGRRCEDDARQIGRWKSCAGDAGRWKRNLIAKCLRANKRFDDASVSPVVRQTLAHWAYELNQKDFDEYARQLRRGKTTSFVPQYTMHHVLDNDVSTQHKTDEDIAQAVADERVAQDLAREERARKRRRRLT